MIIYQKSFCSIIIKIGLKQLTKIANKTFIDYEAESLCDKSNICFIFELSGCVPNWIVLNIIILLLPTYNFTVKLSDIIVEGIFGARNNIVTHLNVLFDLGCTLKINYISQFFVLHFFVNFLLNAC